MKSLTYSEIKHIIDIEDKLISTDYKNNKSLLDIKCNKCNLIYQQNYDRYKQGFRHKDCKNKLKKVINIITPKKIINKICDFCNIEFVSKRKNQKICSRECNLINLNKDIKLNQERGRLGGEKSHSIINKRSKGEILFYDLCCKYFGDINVLSNVKMFIDKNGNKWDADIIIPKFNTCVSYNGIFHYKKVFHDHNFNKQLARDKLKHKIIFDNGFIQYIVKDLKSFNIDFVYNEFHKFIFNRFIHLELLMLKD
jgi:hypothetical protein